MCPSDIALGVPVLDRSADDWVLDALVRLPYPVHPPWFHEAIGVGERDDLTRGLGYADVASISREFALRIPEELDAGKRERNQIRRSILRAIHDNDLERFSTRLPLERAQTPFDGPRRIVRSDHDGDANSRRRGLHALRLCQHLAAKSKADRRAARWVVGGVAEGKAAGHERRDREACSPGYKPDDGVGQQADHGWSTSAKGLPGKQPECARVPGAASFKADADQEERSASPRRKEVGLGIGPRQRCPPVAGV